MRRKQVAAERGCANPSKAGQRFDPAALLKLGVRELCHVETN